MQDPETEILRQVIRSELAAMKAQMDKDRHDERMMRESSDNFVDTVTIRVGLIMIVTAVVLFAAAQMP